MSTPRLIYDGDCAFCGYTVAYARALTGDVVDYQPYQRVAGEHPDISRAEFQASIQLLEAGRRRSGAGAAFRTLELGGRPFWMRLYTRLPGFAWLTERLYVRVSRHRGGSMRASRWLIGPELRPARHERTAQLLIRGISLCALSAFLSLWWQVTALLGPEGVLPAGSYLQHVADSLGAERYYYLPTLFWFSAGSLALHAVCLTGTIAAIAGIAGRLVTASALVQYVCYLSLLHVGQEFLRYQWDVFLLECLLTAALLAGAPGAGIWVARLLLLRFMFLSGFVKLASGDPSWWEGTALAYHFETQPLPNAFSWYAHQLPDRLLAGATCLTLAVELVLPLFVLGPRRPRLFACGAFLALELMILVTGNYNFFNLLTMALCLSLMNDGDLPRWARRRQGSQPVSGSRLTTALAAVVIALGLLQIGHQTRLIDARPLLILAQPWAVANPYGLFAVMTTRRDELVIEGTRDGVTWHPYRFPFKPGDTDRRPAWATPHQPRLDWQMWFAVLDGPGRAGWIYEFVNELLEANPDVLRLVDDPFDGQRPEAIRIRVYRYRFAPRDRSDDAWWERDSGRGWLPPMRLRRPVIRHEPLLLD